MLNSKDALNYITRIHLWYIFLLRATSYFLSIYILLSIYIRIQNVDNNGNVERERKYVLNIKKKKIRSCFNYGFNYSWTFFYDILIKRSIFLSDSQLKKKNSHAGRLNIQNVVVHEEFNYPIVGRSIRLTHEEIYVFFLPRSGVKPEVIPPSHPLLWK